MTDPKAAAKRTPKTYWLIEKGSPAEYYVAGHTPNIVWTRDPVVATRFTSERTANWGIYGCFSSSEAMLDRVRVCEHMDIGEPNHTLIALERECRDTDTILRMLGLDPDVCRTDGGSIMLDRVEPIAERIALLEEALKTIELDARVARPYVGQVKRLGEIARAALGEG